MAGSVPQVAKLRSIVSARDQAKKELEAGNWKPYQDWVALWATHPGFDFALIPDVIDGNETENDALVGSWSLGTAGVPVWHMHTCRLVTPAKPAVYDCEPILSAAEDAELLEAK